MEPLFTTPLNVSKTKGMKVVHGPTLTAAEHNKRDEIINAHMYGLKILRHRNECRVSLHEQLDKVASKYPLNEHVMTMLGLGHAYFETVWDDVPTDEDKIRSMSDSESHSAVDERELIALEETKDDADMHGFLIWEAHLTLFLFFLLRLISLGTERNSKCGWGLYLCT